MEQFKVARWGNSLAIRIPSKIVRELGLKEGDTVSREALGIPRSVAKMTREEALEGIRQTRWKLPKDWKIDRNDPDMRG